MSLAVSGPQRLDELQRMVEGLFTQIPGDMRPGASAIYDRLPVPFAAAAAGEPLLTLMVPVAEQRVLKAAWCLPVADLSQWVLTKPDEIWSVSASYSRYNYLLLTYCYSLLIRATCDLLLLT